ncbi:MAG: hypothetical protein AAFQ89_22210, partial [Cyanobacteria bacterium J06626_18]
PPILSDRCGNWGYSDTVRHRYNGLVYPCGNPEALAEVMLEMTDAEVRQRYSDRSSEVFSEQDLYCEVNAFREVIERIKAQKGVPVAASAAAAASPDAMDRIPANIP